MSRLNWIVVKMLGLLGIALAIAGCASSEERQLRKAMAAAGGYEAYYTAVFEDRCREAGHAPGSTAHTACVTDWWAYRDALNPDRQLPSIASYRQYPPRAGAHASRPMLTKGAHVLGN